MEVEEASEVQAGGAEQQQVPGDATAAAAGEAEAGAAAAADTQPKKPAKRKVAMHLAYLGAGFHGMQRNPGCATIESELEGALVKAGAISEQNAGSFQKIHWNRASRTDKGVSSLCQVVSAKLVIEPTTTFAQRVNTHLPAQIRVFGVQRSTEGFDARKFCDKRKYEYILPAWVFDPHAAAQGRPDQNDKRAKKAGPNSSARLADEAAALQAIAAAVLAAPAETAPPPAAAAAAATAAGAGSETSGSATAAAAAAAGEGIGGAAAAEAGGPNSRSTSSSDVLAPVEAGEDEMASTSKVGQDVLHRLRQVIAVSQQRYVFGASQLERLNGLLSQYEGTHNFHNYTVRVPASDPAARRYIISFNAEMIDIGGKPWVRLVVVGQSFMLHQIRKMVGMVLAIMRNAAPEECLQLALDPDRDFVTPMAPELGLFLDETYYDAYNVRFGELHGPISFEPYRQEAMDFKYSVLYKHIAALDEAELVNALWLRSCTDTNFRFSKWAKQPKVREISKLSQVQQQQAHQQQKAANGPANKRKQEDAAAAGPAKQQQQQPVPKQQRLERPGKLDGASAAMVVGMQETYGMRPHSDTEQAAEARRELREMREEFAKVQAQQQQQQQQQVVAAVDEEELDLLYA